MTREEVIADLTPDEAVAAIQRHLNAGVVGFHGLYAQHQMDYRASYHEVCRLLSGWEERDPTEHDERHVRELRGLLNRLGEFRTVDPGVFAVNTTFHGKDTAFQDHSPRQVA